MNLGDSESGSGSNAASSSNSGSSGSNSASSSGVPARMFLLEIIICFTYFIEIFTKFNFLCLLIQPLPTRQLRLRVSVVS